MNIVIGCDIDVDEVDPAIDDFDVIVGVDAGDGDGIVENEAARDAGSQIELDVGGIAVDIRSSVLLAVDAIGRARVDTGGR